MAPRFGEWMPTAEAPVAAVGTDLTAAEKRGLRAASSRRLVIVVLFALLVWPAIWSGAAGGAPLFDEAAAANGGGIRSLQPFFQSLVAAFFLLFLVTGVAYGRAAGVNRSHRDEIRMISEGMASMSYYIVMAFVAAHFVAMFNWSNLGVILAINGAAGLGRLELPAPVLVAAHRRAGRDHQPRDRFGQREVGHARARAGADADAARDLAGDDHRGLPHGRQRDQPDHAIAGLFPAGAGVLPALGPRLRHGQPDRRDAAVFPWRSSWSAS